MTAMRLTGHRLTLYTVERITTGHCTCGWLSGECTFQRQARSAYRRHLQNQQLLQLRARPACVPSTTGTTQR